MYGLGQIPCSRAAAFARNNNGRQKSDADDDLKIMEIKSSGS